MLAQESDLLLFTVATCKLLLLLLLLLSIYLPLTKMFYIALDKAN